MKASNHNDVWDMTYDATNQAVLIDMPEEDAMEIAARAQEAGISVEAYIRRGFGFPDAPPQARAPVR